MASAAPTTPAARHPVRVSLPAARPVRWPRYCACCLLSLDEPARAGADGLAVPWCDDCRAHSRMRKVDRFVRWARNASWTLAVLLVGLGSLPLLRGRTRWLVLGSGGTFFFLALGLTAVARLKLEDRKESCATSGPPVRLVARTVAGTEVECDNGDFASLLAEENQPALRPPP